MTNTPPHRYMDNPNAKRILIACDEGNNRSVTVASQLKYWGHDCITVGLNRNRPETIALLVERWADLVLLTADDQVLPEMNGDLGVDDSFPDIEVWDLGPDNYPRPYNKVLLEKVKVIIQDHPELKPVIP